MLAPYCRDNAGGLSKERLAGAASPINFYVWYNWQDLTPGGYGSRMGIAHAAPVGAGPVVSVHTAVTVTLVVQNNL
jgi:hypothetical protein